MKILIGTSNPSKVRRFRELLGDLDAEFLTLADLQITDEPEELGSTPEENAVLKAEFYGQFADIVICNDAGLYFEELPLDDPRQPGLNVRTPGGRERLTDEQMVEYYSSLVHSLGGKVSASYIDGYAVYNHGRVASFMDAEHSVKCGSFYMVDTPKPYYNPGWPLDSMSIYKKDGKYFVEGPEVKEEEPIIVGEYRQKVVEFLRNAIQ